MKKTIVMLLLAAGTATHAAQLSQSYDDYIKNNSWSHDNAIQVPKGIKIAPSREIDMSKSPFKREVRHHRKIQRQLRQANKKMQLKFGKSGSKAKETYRHQKLRDQEKLAKKQIVRRYNILCGSEVPKIEKLTALTRGVKKKIAHAKGREKQRLQSIHDKYLAEAQGIIQRWVDDVFVYYDFPAADTWDNKLYPSRHRDLYNKVNKAVQKAIKKGGFAVAEEEREEDEEETGSEYTKKYTEITNDFLSEHFDVATSAKFNPLTNPFKALHGNRVRALDRLSKERVKNDSKDMKLRAGHRRETFAHSRSRENTKETARMISRKFHKLLRKDFLQFEKHVDQIRRWSRIMHLHEGKPRAEFAEKQYQKHIKAGTVILQKMVDNVFAHEPFPTTVDGKVVKTRYKSFYKKASKLYYEG